ncbi:MAG: DNA-binding CsgD family transcriptional regulator [Cyclobacteriaceae bacterium]|jgi:DNA-binding CsgD family transcriptional regulator
MLFIDLKSVESLKYCLFEKTGNKNVAGLVLYGLEHHLID